MFLKIELNGLGWNIGAQGTQSDYAELANYLVSQLKTYPYLQGTNRTAEISIREELDDLHSVLVPGTSLLIK